MNGFRLDGSLGAGSSDTFKLESGPEWEARQRRAVLYVASHARDAGDCALLLDLLGLTEVATGSRGTPAPDALDDPAA